MSLWILLPILNNELFILREGLKLAARQSMIRIFLDLLMLIVRCRCWEMKKMKSKETNTVWYNPALINIDEMEKALKDAGTYLETTK